MSSGASVSVSASAPASGDRFVAVDDVWVGEWTGPAVLRLRAGRVAVLRSAATDGAAVARVGGVVLPGFCDSHVHLGLVDAGALVAGGIARVVDLGWDPTVVAQWAESAASGSGIGESADDAHRRSDVRSGARMPEVSFAGAFLTGVGGYPSGRSWAPDAAVRQLRDVADARTAVAEMHGHGARFAKLVLHASVPVETGLGSDPGVGGDELGPGSGADGGVNASTGKADDGVDGVGHGGGSDGGIDGTTGEAGNGVDEVGQEGGADGGVNASTGKAGDGGLSDEVARAVVEEAHRLGLVVVAHAEGDGQAARAERLGVDRLAHTPWTERLSDELITTMAWRMAWVSTLDIHGWGDRTPEFAVAIDNLTRFAAAGGHVLYGTDLGNGPLPTALNPRELGALMSAGLTSTQLLDALAPFPDLAHSGDAIDAREVAQSAAESATGDTSRYLARDGREAGDAIELGARVSWAPTRAPSDPADLPSWLKTARVVAADDLEEIRA